MILTMNLTRNRPIYYSFKCGRSKRLDSEHLIQLCDCVCDIIIIQIIIGPRPIACCVVFLRDGGDKETASVHIRSVIVGYRFAFTVSLKGLDNYNIHMEMDRFMVKSVKRQRKVRIVHALHGFSVEGHQL
jgi:hypothetical protein